MRLFRQRRPIFLRQKNPRELSSFISRRRRSTEGTKMIRALLPHPSLTKTILKHSVSPESSGLGPKSALFEDPSLSLWWGEKILKEIYEFYSSSNPLWVS